MRRWVLWLLRYNPNARLERWRVPGLGVIAENDSETGTVISAAGNCTRKFLVPGVKRVDHGRNTSLPHFSSVAILRASRGDIQTWMCEILVPSAV